MHFGEALWITALAACATPYQPMGLTGGFEERRLSNGDYVVTVQVNGFTDRSTALEYLHRRAGELCPDGFELVDRSSGDNGGVLVTRSFVDTTHKPEENAIVRCQNPKRERELDEVRAAAARDRARKRQAPEPPPRGFFCTSSPSQLKLGACSRQKAGCVQVRGAALAVAADLTPCTLVESAFCFDAGSGNDLERCAATEAACTAQHDAALATTLDTPIGDCAEQT
ncbi:MAG: hypothetical protein KF773_34805 [Deltaproteobacteria bacterium]|nr:hypothetical protein [Deltaproteobacteria bacterium]